MNFIHANAEKLASEMEVTLTLVPLNNANMSSTLATFRWIPLEMHLKLQLRLQSLAART